MTAKYTKIFFYTILPLLIFSIGTLTLPSQAGHLNAPVHNISLDFDLETNSLSANSRIELPAGVGLQMDLSLRRSPQ